MIIMWYLLPILLFAIDFFNLISDLLWEIPKPLLILFEIRNFVVF